MKSLHHILHLFLILAVVFALTSFVKCKPSLATRRFCSFYYHSSISGCRLCKDRCRVGEGFVKNCGYDAYGRKIKSACAPCKDGFFSPRKYSFIVDGPSLACRPCRRCYPSSRTKRACSPTRNTKCTRCPRGMYKHKDGHCYKCSYCCNGMIEKKINVVESCRRRNPSQCICKEDTLCYDSVDYNARCPAYSKKNNVEARIKMKSWSSLKLKGKKT